jgi:DNA polymerase-3 subunit epsilon/CBS domain-containing protein
MLPVHGDAKLCETLWRSGFDLAKGDVTFVKSLAEAAGEFEDGLGWFGRFNTEDGRIDLKRCGLFGIVTTARLLAIRYHVVERATPARLAGLRALSIGAGSDLEALDSAQAVFLDLILAQQISDIAQGRTPSNKVSVKHRSSREREQLRQALEAVRPLNELKRDILFAG